MPLAIQMVVRLVAGSVTGLGLATPSVAQTGLLRAKAIRVEAMSAYGAGYYGEAADRFDDAVRTGVRSAALLYQAGVASAKAGRADRAFRSLRRAIEAGVQDDFSADSDLVALYGDRRWPELLRRSDRARERYRAAHGDPAAVRLVTSDIERFWRAYDAAIGLPVERWIPIFRREYFGGASPGLQNFFLYKIRSESLFVQRIRENPVYYAGLRRGSLEVARGLPQLRHAFARLKELYPQAVFPDVYFLMGGLSSGGTSVPEGLLIGADLYGVGPGMPRSELPPALTDRVVEAAALPFVVAHEAIHFFQTTGGSLLRESLIEGGADFLATRMVGDTAVTGEEELHAYGNRHEREIWERFRQEMHGTDWSNWIANRERVSPGTPSDLGYYVGFKICEAYYARARSKQEAVREIIAVRDAPALLAASGYAERFASP